MTLNANNVQSKRKEYVPLNAGTYPARVVQVIDLGLQAQRPWKGEEKVPAYEIGFTYELSDEFMKDEDGQDDPAKPRWITEFMPLSNLKAEKAKSTARYKVLDPKETFGGDFSKTLGLPVNITIVQSPGKGANAGRIYENIAGTSVMRDKDAAKLPPLVNKAVFFDLDNPDIEVFNKLPKFLQERIRGNLEFKGSKLEALVGATTSEPAKEEVNTPPKTVKADEESPY
jgi:hypothetical protein